MTFNGTVMASSKGRSKLPVQYCLGIRKVTMIIYGKNHGNGRRRRFNGEVVDALNFPRHIKWWGSSNSVIFEA